MFMSDCIDIYPNSYYIIAMHIHVGFTEQEVNNYNYQNIAS